MEKRKKGITWCCPDTTQNGVREKKGHREVTARRFGGKRRINCPTLKRETRRWEGSKILRRVEAKTLLEKKNS